MIENPDSVAPGFTVENVHVMAGVPSVMRAMLDALLPSLPRGKLRYRRRLVYRRPESEIAASLEKIEQEHAGVTIGSYPKMGGPVEVILTALDESLVERAYDAMLVELGPEDYGTE